MPDPLRSPQQGLRRLASEKRHPSRAMAKSEFPASRGRASRSSSDLAHACAAPLVHVRNSRCLFHGTPAVCTTLSYTSRRDKITHAHCERRGTGVTQRAPTSLRHTRAHKVPVSQSPRDRVNHWPPSLRIQVSVEAPLRHRWHLPFLATTQHQIWTELGSEPQDELFGFHGL